MGFRYAAVFMTLLCFGCLVACSSGGSDAQTGSTNAQSSSPPNITSIALSPQNSAVTIGKTITFTATATYSDGSSKDISSSAKWQTNNNSSATVRAGVVTGMQPGVVNVTANAGSVSATALLNVTYKEFDNASLSGAYAFFLIAGSGPSLQLEAGSFSADGNGNIAGVEDLNAPSGIAKDLTLTGTYSITLDGRGTLTLNTAGQGSRTLRFILSSNSGKANDNNGGLVEFDGTNNAVGKFEKQDSAAFTNAALANATYVFRIGGVDSGQKSISTIGTFTTNSVGSSISNGMEDVNDNGVINNGSDPATALSIAGGSIGAIDSKTGRATASLTASDGETVDLAFYIVSGKEIEIIGLDAAPTVGTAEKQDNPAPSSVTSGGYAFQSDMGGIVGRFWMSGEFGVDNTSKLNGVVASQDDGTNLVFPTPAAMSAATFTMSSTGRGTFQQITSNGDTQKTATIGSLNITAYMVSSSKMYVLQTNDSHAPSGIADLQQPGSDGFGLSSLNNTFAIYGAEIGDGNVAFVGELVADGFGHISGIEDVSQPQSGNPSKLKVSTVALDATYSAPAAVGGLSVGITTQGNGVTGLRVVLASPSKAIFVGLPNDADGVMIVQ